MVCSLSLKWQAAYKACLVHYGCTHWISLLCDIVLAICSMSHRHNNLLRVCSYRVSHVCYYVHVLIESPTCVTTCMYLSSLPRVLLRVCTYRVSHVCYYVHVLIESPTCVTTCMYLSSLPRVLLRACTFLVSSLPVYSRSIILVCV